MAKSPQSQHAEHAKKILARRARKEAEAKANEPALPPELLDAPEDGTRTDPAGVDAVPEPVNPEATGEAGEEVDYTTWEKKDLKAECDRRSISYPGKVTNTQLVDLLLGVS